MTGFSHLFFWTLTLAEYKLLKHWIKKWTVPLQCWIIMPAHKSAYSELSCVDICKPNFIVFVSVSVNVDSSYFLILWQYWTVCHEIVYHYITGPDSSIQANKIKLCTK